MVNCGACGKFLSAAGGAACSACSLKYHKICLNISEKTSIAKDWVCPNCKKSTRRGDNSQTPVKSIGDSPSPPSTQVSPPIVAKCDVVDTKEERRYRELVEFMTEMRQFRDDMNKLRVSLSARIDSIESRLDALEQFKPDSESGVTAELENTIRELKQELNERDQEALLSDLEIGELPEDKGVSVVQTVIVLAGRMGVALEERDVVFAERVGPPPAEAGGRPRRVVVRLARRHLRDELLRAARVRRTLTSAAGGRVFINERLTRLNRQLFHRAREECRRLQWRFTWTRRGRVCARQAEGSPMYQLRSLADVVRVFGAQKD